MPWREAVVATLRATARDPAAVAAAPRWSHIGGNAGSSVWSLALGAHRVFVKIADLAHADMLAAEAEGLAAIAQSATLRVPDVLASGQAEGAAFLALEWLDIADGGRDAALGRALAAMHAVAGPRFGWHRDNTIGTTPQGNGWSDDWPTFFRDRRIAPQLALVEAKSVEGTRRLLRDGDKLVVAIPALLAGAAPAASLLHGDLWAGNAGALADGSRAVFDPAVYYGDREADLAMTELFGGFQPDFYAAYAEAAPLASGYETRRTLYNLYHVLNHLNLFGAAYARQAETMIGQLLAAVR